MALIHLLKDDDHLVAKARAGLSGAIIEGEYLYILILLEKAVDRNAIASRSGINQFGTHTSPGSP